MRRVRINILTALTRRCTYPVSGYTSWERPQNEQHNDLFRAFVPKGISMENYSPEYILSAADELNARPHRKLAYYTPEELFDAFLDRVYAVDSKPA